MFVEDFGGWIIENISVDFLEELVTGEDPSYRIDTVGIRKVDLTIADADLYNEYLSYNSDTGQFTILKSFYAKLEGWIINNPTGTSDASGALRVNGTQVLTFTISQGVRSTYRQMNTGDLLDVYVTDTRGWPCPRLRISGYISTE